MNRSRSQAGKNLFECRVVGRYRDGKRKDQVGDTEINRQRRTEALSNAPGSAQGAPCTEDKKHLPAKRVEIPASLGERRQVPAELTCREIKRERCGHGQVALPQHHPQHRGEASHQQNMDLQHVEVKRPRLQQQPVSHGTDRLFEQARDIEFIDDVRGGEARSRIADRHRIDRKQDDEGGVELPGAPEQACGPDNGAPLQHDLREQSCRGISRDENEHVGGAAETEVAQRDPVHPVVWNVVQKHEPVRYSKEQNKPRIARIMRENCLGIHGAFYAMAIGNRFLREGPLI